MSSTLRVLLVAGEASGDLHGAAFVGALRRRAPGVEVAGIGGDRLRAAGMRILVDTATVATMGFVETFGMMGRVLRAYRRVTRFLVEERPDLVVLIDYPEFNLIVARQAKRRGVPVFYFIGPQVWAWRSGRVRKIVRRVDRMGLVFPFEPELYNRIAHRNGEPLARFVGHPLLDVVEQTRSREQTLERYGLDPSRPVLALLPGSRKKELSYLLAPMSSAAVTLSRDGWQPVLALAPSLQRDDVARELPGGMPEFPVIEGDTYNVIAAANAAVVASGTATLETALLGCPMVIVYRVSPVTYWLARRLVHVSWIGMPNIILQRSVFPELIQERANADEIVRSVRALGDRRVDMREALAVLRQQLGEPGAAERAATLALELVR